MKNNRIKKFAEQQYKNHQNLSKRINLWSYGSNPESLQKWIFSKIKIQKFEKILEIGCGTGQLWLESFKNIPSTCSIVLSDFSKEMLNNAEENLKPLNLPIEFEIIDAEKIPYPNRTFDVVIGCNMLYHIPNIHKALRSINRVLKPGGRFISTTVSQQHMRELKVFLSKFGLYSEERMNLFSEFRIETGKNVLKPFFEEIQLYKYINHVSITAIDPLMRYIESIFPKELYPEFQEKKIEVEECLIKILENKSKFNITGITGLFKSKKSKMII